MNTENCQVKHLIEYAIAQGCVISVWDGGEWLISRSNHSLTTVEVCLKSPNVLTLFINYKSKPVCNVKIHCATVMTDADQHSWVTQWFKTYTEIRGDV